MKKMEYAMIRISKEYMDMWNKLREVETGGVICKLSHNETVRRAYLLLKKK